MLVLLRFLTCFIPFGSTVGSGAEERTFSGARLDVLIFRLRSYHVLNYVHCRKIMAKISQTNDVLSSG